MIANGEGWTLYQGDCLEVLPTLEAGSMDAVITDPPYELAFMSKHWDATGIAYNVDLWREVLRVLKPGGHLLAFGGTRTYHRITVAIEDAGFEIRDCIQWLYGSGFPKSKSMRDIDRPELGTALKPSHEPIVLARKPLAASTVAANVLEHGVGAINISACRVETGDNLGRSNHVGPYSSERTWSTSATRGIDNTNNPPAGRWPSNLVLSHSGGCVKVGRKRVKSSVDGVIKASNTGAYETRGSRKTEGYQKQGYSDADGMEEVDEWRCAPGCAVAALDSQAGERKSGGFPSRHGIKNTGYDDAGVYGTFRGADTGREKLHASEGSASRFFPVFAYEADDFVPWLYCAKASRREREAGLEGMERVKMRDDLTDEQRAYVMAELKAAGVVP